MAPTPPPLDLTSRTPSFPPVGGGVSLIQSRYGKRGNFELVAPDTHDGLWVFWFDNDEPGRGVWSSGLRFAEGRRFDDVCMVQSVHGPNHLEVIARSGTEVHRYRWSPELGFTHEGTLPAPPAAGRVALAETPDGLLHAAVPLADSGVAHLVADPSAYPQLTWTDHGVLRPGEQITAASLVPTSDGTVRLHVLADGTVHNVDTAEKTAGSRGAASSRVVAHATIAAPDGSCHVIAVTADSKDADLFRLHLWQDDGSDEADGIPLPGHGPVTSLAATTASFDPSRIDVAIQCGTGIIHLQAHR